MPTDDPDDCPFEPDPYGSDDIKMLFVFARFPVGQLVATPAALEALERSGEMYTKFLARHARADWGDLGDEDIESNNEALRHGGRLLSAYQLADAGRLWIITEADRSVTTVLLPSDY